MTLPLSPEELKDYNNMPWTPKSQPLGDTINALIGGGLGGGAKINFTATPQLGLGGPNTAVVTIPPDPNRAGKCVVIVYCSPIRTAVSTNNTISLAMQNLSTATFLTTFTSQVTGFPGAPLNDGTVTEVIGAGLGPGTYDAGGTPVTGSSDTNYLSDASITSIPDTSASDGAATFVWVDSAPSVGANSYEMTLTPNGPFDFVTNPSFLFALHSYEIAT